MAFLVALVLLVVFVANVVVGSIAGNPIIGNVGEMLILFGSSIAFTVGILKREAIARTAKNNKS